MTFQETLRVINEDLERITTSRFGKIRLIIFSPISKFLLAYRLGGYFMKAPLYLKPLKIFNGILYRHYKYKLGIELEYGTKIGGGLKIQHYQDIVINGASVIGKNCSIYNGVTLGANLYQKGPRPVLGDNVVVCTGAKLLGGVHIGDNSIIAANAVVTHDVPSGCIAAGVPAKIIATGQEEKAKLWLNRGLH